MVRHRKLTHARHATLLSLITGALIGCGGAGSSDEPAHQGARPTSEAPGEPASPGTAGRAFPPALPSLEAPAGTRGGEASPSVLGRIGQTTDFVIDVTLPANGERNARAAALAEAHRQAAAYRNLNPSKLRHALRMNTAYAEPIKSVLNTRSDSEVIRLLARYLTETNEARAAATSSLLVDEVFSDEDYAGSKLAEISFDLAELGRRGYYDEPIATRVALLQAMIDQSKYRDQIRDVAKVTLFVAGTMLLPAFLAGKRWDVIETGTEAVRRVPFNELFKMPSLEGLSTGGLRSITNLERISERAAKHLPKEAVNVVRSELNVLKFSQTEINRLGLETAQADDLARLAVNDDGTVSRALEWRATDRTRLDFALSNKWLDRDLGSDRVLLFRVRRTFLPTRVVLGPHVSAEKAAELERRLARQSNVEYLNAVDEAGGVEQTAIRADTREEFASQGVKTPRAVRLGKTPETPKFAPAKPLEEVETKRFDYVRAAITATAVGSLTAPTAFVGYVYGKGHGLDDETLNLERQVNRLARPPEPAVSGLNPAR